MKKGATALDHEEMADSPKPATLKKRLVLVDDHVSAREMMALVLKREGRWDIVGTTHSGLRALDLCRELERLSK